MGSNGFDTVVAQDHSSEYQVRVNVIKKEKQMVDPLLLEPFRSA
jgi:hypothetical protein